MHSACTSKAIACVIASAVSTLGCATREYQDVREAREAYEGCVAQSSDAAPDCDALLERLRVAEQRYEDHSRSAWGCNTGDPDCPMER